MTTPKPPPTARSLPRIRREREAIELFSDFLAASESGLSRVEELLLERRRSAADVELAHELLRVFHAIKGVSAILKLLDVTRLAHATEVLLGGARSGRYPLSVRVLELVSAATIGMRRLLAEVQRAVERDLEIRSVPDVAGLIAEIEAEASRADEDGEPPGDAP